MALKTYEVYGTHHFTSQKAAQRYYKPYGFEAADIANKITEQEIAIGRPEYRAGLHIKVNKDGRYCYFKPEVLR